METEKLALKQTQQLQTVIGYLEGLVEGLAVGRIVVERDDEFVTLSPAPMVEVKVEARRKRDKEKFSLELSWARQGELDSPVRILTRPPRAAGPTAKEAAPNAARKAKNAPHPKSKKKHPLPAETPQDKK